MRPPSTQSSAVRASADSGPWEGFAALIAAAQFPVQAPTAPPLGAYRNSQVPVVDIASTAGIAMPDRVDAAVLQLTGAALTSAQRSTAGRIGMSPYDVIVLTRHRSYVR